MFNCYFLNLKFQHCQFYWSLIHTGSFPLIFDAPIPAKCTLHIKSSLCLPACEIFTGKTNWLDGFTQSYGKIEEQSDILSTIILALPSSVYLAWRGWEKLL